MSDPDNTSSNPTLGSTPTLDELISVRLSRRSFLGGMAALSGTMLVGCASSESTPMVSGPAFKEVLRGLDETHHVAEGYQADVLLRWGDPLFSDSPAFDPMNQTEASQLRQFGFNNDYIGFVPLEENRGLLCVNHEYVSTALMQPGVVENYPDSMTRERCAVELAAHGGTVVEIVFDGRQWNVVRDSKYNRRITPHKTPMEVTGPAAGHPRLKTSDDPSGRLVAGTMNNCAGGITPWGTWLMAEENFNVHFLGELPEGHPEAANHKRYGIPWARYQWGRHFSRFDISSEPNEPNRFGWIVEVDPMNPDSKPKKRTALGRFKHEGAESVVAPDGRVVIYMGDDQQFDYVYKFVSAKAVDKTNPAANVDLLDEGTLYVARFDADGTLDWMPLVFGEGPLTPENGFRSQADVLIETRRSADLLGATPMDRPEDVEPHAGSGRAWVMLTNNSAREADQVDAANPRAKNRFGHIVEISEPNGDFTATKSRWDILLRCGDPTVAEYGAAWNPETSEAGWFTCPDNCAVDPRGRLWVATDGNERTGSADGLWCVEVDGANRARSKAFFRVPVGAELCGPRFTADGRTLFVAIQHPGDGRGASFEKPSTRWPDFRDDMPPRPSVMVVRKDDGGFIGD